MAREAREETIGVLGFRLLDATASAHRGAAVAMALPGRGGGGGIVGRENPAAQRRGDMSPASKEARLRVLLADDHPIVLAGVRAG